MMLVMTRTNFDKRKIESAGVESGLKIFGICEGPAGSAAQTVAAIKNPASKNAMPRMLLARLRVCSLHFICFELARRRRRSSGAAFSHFEGVMSKSFSMTTHPRLVARTAPVEFFIPLAA